MVGREREQARAETAGRWSRLAALALLGLLLATGVARADDVDALLADLKGGRDYKVRLSAALNLAKLGDDRAVPGFLAALGDPDKTVRGAAVVGLGKLIDAATPVATRTQVVAALDKLAKGAADDTLTRQAIKLRDSIAKMASAVKVIQGGIYIDLAPMSTKQAGTDGLRDLMRTTAQSGLARLDPRIMQAWPTGKSPTQKEFDRASIHGFYIDGTIQDVTVVQKGAATLVSCKLSMLIATFPGKSIFGFLEGGAKVQGSNTARDIELAKQDCITAVVEDLVAKKIMPTIRTKAGPNL